MNRVLLQYKVVALVRQLWILEVSISLRVEPGKIKLRVHIYSDTTCYYTKWSLQSIGILDCKK